MTAGKFLLISASLLSVLDITALGSICQCNDQYGSIYTSLPVKTQYKNVQDYSASLSGHSGIGLSEYATQQTSERGYERLQLYKSENNQEYSYKKHLELTQPQYKNLLEVQGNNKQPYAQPVYSVQPLSLQYKKVQQTPNIQYAKYTEGLESGNKELEYLLKSNEQNNYQVKDDTKEYKTEQENTKYAVSSPIYVEKKITPSYDNKNQEQDKYIPRTSHGQGNEYEGYSHGDEGHKDYHHDKNIYYKFEYAVNDKKSHDIKHQKEERKGDKVEGVYSLVEDGGNVRTVKYVADWKNGFRAEVLNSKKPKSY
ncbi:uncharacterized protein LOC114326467 [Diabrotica virgifera virgifera]|uniref:Uncharacterized protein n=1 Tax=Diabrotica virgifera virgifera TaxID=50390 RepID=A0ABM5IDV5_DIAVI|nr:uncharacterized protein LOC114326467 [Diabrotica virgifera virgifera]